MNDRLPNCSSFTDTQCGSAATLRGEMGLFPFASTIGSMSNPFSVTASAHRHRARHAADALLPSRCWPPTPGALMLRARLRSPSVRHAPAQISAASQLRASRNRIQRRPRSRVDRSGRGPPPVGCAALEPVAARRSGVCIMQHVATECSRAVEPPFILRSVMNRFTQKVVSGGIAAGLTRSRRRVRQRPGGAVRGLDPERARGRMDMTGRDYSLQRFSPLKQITTSNVGELRPVWSFSTGTLRGHEGNPLVVGNVMYVNTSFPNIVYALDLSKPGAPQIWKYVPNQSPDAIPIACCDLVNRGTAYSPSGKIYIQALQGELIALDAKTGKELWKAKHPDKSNAGVEANGYKQGATMTNAPIYIKTKSGKEMVIAGISGGEFGVRGRVSAFDANSGAARVDRATAPARTAKS